MLMLLHHFELLCQLLKNVLLLGRKILGLLEGVKHLKLLLAEVELRSLRLLDRLFPGFESLRWCCIVVALDRVGRWRSGIRLLKIGKLSELIFFHSQAHGFFRVCRQKGNSV